MKRIKFMLFSLALVAIVGGGLAFKLKNTHHFCTTLARAVIINGQNTFTCKDPSFFNLICPNFTSRVTVGGNFGNFYCTTPDNGALACDLKTICLPTLQKIFTDND